MKLFCLTLLSIVMLMPIFNPTPVAAQSDYICDGSSDNDISVAISAALAENDFDTALELYGMVETVCADNLLAMLNIGEMYLSYPADRFAYEQTDFIENATPGMVDIGDYSLFMVCEGEITDQPTIILENGMGADLTVWDGMMSELTERTQVCRYHRLGYAPSDPVPDDTARSAVEQAADLEAVLETAEIEGPYILVGHSLGSFVMIAYSQAYPENVAGLVFVDGSHYRQFIDYPQFYGPAFVRGPELIDLDATATAFEEFDFEVVADIPAYVLMAQDSMRGSSGDAWQTLQADHAARYHNSQLNIAINSSHMILFDQPDTIITAVDWVLEQIANQDN